MSEFKVLFAEGSSVNRPPMFNGMNYAFWKIRMKIFMEPIDALIWEAVVHGPYVLASNVNLGVKDLKIFSTFACFECISPLVFI